MANYDPQRLVPLPPRLERYLDTLANDESATWCIPTEDDTRQASMRGDKHPESFNEERFDAVCSLCGLWIPGPEGGVCTNCEASGTAALFVKAINGIPESGTAVD